ncbi:MAG: tetratricopeptide repeat protein [Planctomycetota bacterium JB042]
MSDPLLRAEQLFRWRRHAEARKAIVEALAEDPDRADAHRLLALVQLELGEEEAADAAAREAIRLEPDRAAAHHVHAFVLLRRGRVDEAPLRLAEAIRLAPHDPDLHALEATMRAAWREWPAAEAAARRALAIDPSHAEALDAFAAAALARGRLPTAERAVRAALSADPDDATLHRRLGEILERRRDATGAARASAAATRLDPTHEETADRAVRTARRSAPRTGRLHAGLARLEDVRRSHGLALLLLAPFVTFGLDRATRGDAEQAPLLPLPAVEWGAFLVLLAVFGANALSRMIERGGSAAGPGAPPAPLRRTRRRLGAVSIAAVTFVALGGAGPARLLASLLWLLAADADDDAAARPRGPDRDRGRLVAAAVVGLAIVLIGWGLLAPPLPVGVGIVVFLGALATVVVARRRGS